MLRLELLPSPQLIGFWNDIALVVARKQRAEVIIVANEVLAIIRRWLTSLRLTLGNQKSEVVLITI